MPIVKKLQKFGRLPTSLIVNGADFLGVSLAESLLEQSSKVIIVDEFTASNRDRVKHLMESDLFTFADYSILDNLDSDNTRIDYVFYLSYDLSYREEKIDTQHFMKESQRLDKVLKLGIKKKVKFLYASSMEVDRYITSMAQHGEVPYSRSAEHINYTTMELQRYAENLVIEYHKKSALNARIIRLGEIYGEGMELDRKSELARLLRSAVKEKKLTIYGEGLQTRYYLHLLDATYGLIKAQFGNNTNGEVFSLANPEEISELSLAYKILEFNPNAEKVVFEEVDRRIYPSRISIPAENLTVIGWSPHIDFEKGLYKAISYFYKALGMDWKNRPYKEEPEVDSEKEDSKEEHQGDAAPSPEKEVKAPQDLEIERIEVNPDAVEENKATDLLSDKTKRVIEIGQDDTGDEKVVRILPLEEDRVVRRNLMNRALNIPKTVKDPDILKTLVTLAVFIPLFILVILPILRLGIFTIAGGSMGLVAGMQVQSLNLPAANMSLKFSHSFFTRASTSLKYFEQPTKLVGLSSVYTQSTYFYSMAEHFAAAGESATAGLAPWAKYLAEFEPLINPNDPSESNSSAKLSYKENLEEISDSSEDLRRAAIEFREAKNAYNSINKEVFPWFIENPLTDLGEKMDEISSSVDKAVSVVDYAPELLGKDGRQNYLILFQNPFEVRSTGGWIGGYALIGIEEGQIRKLEVDDIYNADGILQVENREIPPPQDMQEALDITQWTLSLSNWNPDFQLAAKDAEYLSGQILETSDIDGVIAVDTYVLKDILKIIGEVDTGGQEGRVDDKTLFNVILTLREDFQPGSQKKSSFLGRLANEVLSNILKLSRDKWPQVAEVIVKNLDEKHILIAFDNPDASRAVIDNDWGGSLISDDDCSFNLYVVDYNWSGNKVNHYVERSIHITSESAQVAGIDETLRVDAEISYKNTSEPDTFEGGDYDNYVRVYLPDAAQVLSYTGIDEARVYRDQSKTIVAGWVRVAAEETETVEISYDLTIPGIADEASSNDFSVCVQKQPGMEKLNLELDLQTSIGTYEDEVELGDDYMEIAAITPDKN